VKSGDQNDEMRQGRIIVASLRLTFNADITTDSFSEYDHAESREATRAMRYVQMESRIGGTGSLVRAGATTCDWR